MSTLFLALIPCVLIHIATLALSGHFAGVAIREVSFGYGPTLLAIGPIKLRLFLIGGYVKFKDSRMEALPPEQTHDAFDHLPLRRQLPVVLSGCCVLLGIAMAILGASGVLAFASGFQQFLVGAVWPFFEAQSLLQAARILVLSEPYLIVFAVVAAKFAALNLLPFPMTNGGAALALIGMRTPLAGIWSPRATRVLSVLHALAGATWLIAILYFALASG